MSAALDRRAREHFDSLSREQATRAIVRMHREGYSPHTIAAATRLTVEEIRRVLADIAACDSPEQTP